MFRQFDNIQITDEKIRFTMIETLEEVTVEFANTNPIDWMTEDHQTWYGTRGESCFLGGRWLIIRTKCGKELKVFMNKEVRYTICKSLRGSGLFDLNYRKHIRAKYSRKHMDVYFIDGIEEEIKGSEDEAEFDKAVTEIKNLAEEYSFGIESKPVVVVSPSWDTEKHLLAYIIIKDEKIVRKGAY